MKSQERTGICQRLHFKYAIILSGRDSVAGMRPINEGKVEGSVCPFAALALLREQFSYKSLALASKCSFLFRMQPHNELNQKGRREGEKSRSFRENISPQTAYELFKNLVLKSYWSTNRMNERHFSVDDNVRSNNMSAISGAAECWFAQTSC